MEQYVKIGIKKEYLAEKSKVNAFLEDFKQLIDSYNFCEILSEEEIKEDD